MIIILKIVISMILATILGTKYVLSNNFSTPDATICALISVLIFMKILDGIGEVVSSLKGSGKR